VPLGSLPGVLIFKGLPFLKSRKKMGIKRILINKKKEKRIGTNISSGRYSYWVLVVNVQEKTYNWKGETIAMLTHVPRPL
jgi:hypothetical protein